MSEAWHKDKFPWHQLLPDFNHSSIMFAGYEAGLQSKVLMGKTNFIFSEVHDMIKNHEF